MDVHHTPESQQADSELSAALESPLSDNAREEDGHDRLQMRIAEYEERVLEHPDPLVASVGALNADLLTMAQRVSTGINRALEEGSDTIESIRDLADVFSTFKQINLQISRNAEFVQRADKAVQELESLKITLKQRVGSGGGLSAALPRGLAANPSYWSGR